MSEKKAVVIFFPVSPHVFKYLQKKVGEKLIVSKQNFYGNLVLDGLSQKYSVLKGGSDQLQFPAEISMRYMANHGIYLNNSVLRKFNVQVDNAFREEMRTYVAVNYEFNNFQKKKSLQQFLDSFSITEDDIKLETLLKDLVRNTRDNK